LEEELPRLRSLILSVWFFSVQWVALIPLQSLANENSVVRSAASMVVVASQIVLGDQAHLFALLDGLSEEKKNFLTYMFNKNGVHAGETMAKSGTSFRRVELEMDKLDDRLDPR
jgi:CLIP-associating protein 1/2